MSPVKTLAKESYFLASIFSKTLFSFFKTLRQQLACFFTKIQNLFLAQNKGKN